MVISGIRKKRRSLGGRNRKNEAEMSIVLKNLYLGLAGGAGVFAVTQAHDGCQRSVKGQVRNKKRRKVEIALTAVMMHGLIALRTAIGRRLLLDVGEMGQWPGTHIRVDSRMPTSAGEYVLQDRPELQTAPCGERNWLAKCVVSIVAGTC